MPFIEALEQSEWNNYNFDKREIKYVNPDGSKLTCVGSGNLNRSFGTFFTDLQYYDEYPSDQPRNGWLVVACTDSGGGDDYVLDFDGLLNGYLSTKRLIDNYWQHGRSALLGQINGIDTTFTSSVRLKEEDDFGVPICCEDDFNPRLNVKTPNGSGRIVSAEHDLKFNKLTLKLEY